MIIGDDTVNVTGDDDYTVAAGSDGVSTVSGLGNGAAASVDGAEEGIYFATDEEGDVTIQGAPYSVDEEGEGDGVTFGVDSKGAVTSIDSLDGTISGDFSNPVTVNGSDEPVQVLGDADSTVSVAATTDDGVSEIGGVNGSDVTIASAGGADKVEVAPADGEDSMKVTFGTGDATQTFEVTGDDDGVTFNLSNDGTVNGVDDLEGDLAMDGTGEEFKVNDTPMTVASGDEDVTISADDKGSITGVDGVNKGVAGVPSDATVGVAGSDVTVNGSELKVAGDEDGYTVSLDDTGTPSTINGLSDGATVDPETAKEVDNFVTDPVPDEAVFTIGDNEVTISGDDDGVNIKTDENGSITAVDDLDGDLAISGNETMSVNGQEVEIEKADGNDSPVTISGADDSVSAIDGLENGDKVRGKLAGVDITMPEAENPEDGAPTSISGLSDNSTLTVSEPGSYVITNEDGSNTRSLDLEPDNVVYVDEDGSIIKYDEDNFNLDGNTALEDIAAQIVDDYVPVSAGGGAYDTPTGAEKDYSDANDSVRVEVAEDGDQNIKLNDEGNNIVIVDDSVEGAKDITLGNGGDNVVIGDDNDDQVTVTAGKGDDEIVSKSDAVVKTNDEGKTKVSPLNDATITLDGYDDKEFENGTGVQTSLGDIAKAIEKGKLTFDGTTASVDGAGAVDFGDADGDGITKSNFYNTEEGNPDNKDTAKGTQVGFTGDKGGNLDMSDAASDAKVVMIGNYPASADKESTTITGGAANDSIFAGAGDSINAGGGENKITLTDPEDRTDMDKGATVTADADNAKTEISGFNFGSDAADDNLKTGDAAIDKVYADDDGNITLGLSNGSSVVVEDAEDKTIKFENQYTKDADGKVTPMNAKFGKDELEITDDANFYWAADSDATVTVSDKYTGSGEFDLTNDNFNDPSKPSFYTDNVKDLDASAFNGEATLIGNDNDNVLTASSVGSYLEGGKGDDTLVGGEGDDTFIAGEGNDVIKGFEDGEFVTTGDKAIDSIAVDSDDVILTLADGSKVTVEDAVGKEMNFDNAYTKNAEGNETPMKAIFGDDSLEITDDANFYWAADTDATVTVSDKYTGSGDFDLSNAEFNDPSKPSFYTANVKDLDASAFDGEATLKGNDKGNVLTASKKGSVLDGGAGNDTLIGAVGVADTFIAGEGDDVITGFEDGELLNTGDKAIDSVSVDGEDLVVALADGSKVTLEKAAGKNVQFANDFTKDSEGNVTPMNAKFGKDELELNNDANFYWATESDATVTVSDKYTGSGDFNLTNDNFNDPSKPSFYTANVKDLDASAFDGEATLTGNDQGNVLTASKGGSTLDGGKGNDTLVGSEKADFFVVSDGSDSISGFTAGTGENADKISVSGAIDTIEAKDGNVILTVGDDKITIDGVAGEPIQFENEHTNGIINMTVEDNKLDIKGNGLYWASGEQATVSLKNYTDTTSVSADLSNYHFDTNKDGLTFAGDIQELDATGYAGTAELTGNSNNNIIRAGNGNSTLWGGEGGDDTLYGGNGTDKFIYGKNNGNDIIRNAASGDIVELTGISLDDLDGEFGAGFFSDNDAKISLINNGGVLTVIDAKTTGGITFKGDDFSYTIKDGEWKNNNN